MTAEQHHPTDQYHPTDQRDLVMRPITGGEELDLFSRFPYVLNRELAGDLTDQRRRTAWMWVALHGDRLLARVAWWSPGGDDTPLYLDIFDVDDSLPADRRLDVGERLLRTAMAATLPAGPRPPGYLRFIPPDWRATPATRSVVEDRMAALQRTGARPLVERLRLEWRPGAGVAEPSGRLVFRPVGDAEELLTLMTQVLDGTLDAHSRDDLARLSPGETARQQYDSLARFPSPRGWWRIAVTPGGEPVGFVIPARNAYHPIIAYIGVVPAHRGHGYIDDLLAEGTRVLLDQGVPRIRAATDLGNTPMADSFRRAGYVAFEHAISMVWP